MNRLPQRIFYVMALLLLVLASKPADGQEGAAQKAPVVVVISSSWSESYHEVVDGFWQLLGRRHQGIEKHTYFLGTEALQNQEIMAEVGSLEPELVFTLGTRATQEAQAAWPDRPLVATMVIDERLLTQSKQTTGVSLRFPARIHLHWLRRIVPAARRIYLLYNPAENADMLTALTQEAKQYPDLSIHGLAVESISQLPAALKSVERQADVLLGIADQTVYSGKTATAVLLSTFQERIPFAGLSRSWVRAGALYALERDYPDLGRQCGEMVCRILAGTKVADIPPASPERVLWVLNMKTARHLRLNMNPLLIEEAAEVFQ